MPVYKLLGTNVKLCLCSDGHAYTSDFNFKYHYDLNYPLNAGIIMNDLARFLEKRCGSSSIEFMNNDEWFEEDFKQR